MRLLNFLIILTSIYSSIYAGFNTPTILITGATSGIGQVIAKDLATQGYDLCLAGRNVEKLQTLKESLMKYKINTEIYSFDYSNYQSISDLKKVITKPLTGLVVIPPRPTLPRNVIPEPQQFEKAVKEVFIAPLEFIRTFQSNLLENSSVVFIGGVTSVYYMPNYSNSNVLQTMWAGEIKNLAHQLGKNKIRANLISSDVILTDFQINKITKQAEENKITFAEQLKNQTANTPLDKYGEPQDVADATSFLLSPKSKHITGTNMVLDGGASRSY